METTSTSFNFRSNNAFSRTRQLVERTIGQWKRKLHSLHSELRIAIDRVPQYIMAAAVIHNICRMHDLLELNGGDEDPILLPNNLNSGDQVRNHIVGSHFTD